MQQLSNTDWDLVERTRRGDNQAFADLWARYEGSVLAVCRRYVWGPRADPAVDEHDLALDTFIRALHHIERHGVLPAQGRTFQAWLLTVARHTCLNALEKQRRRMQWCTSSADVDTLQQTSISTVERMAEGREVLRTMARVINTLPETYRRPFKLLLEGYSQNEIAAALGITPETARKRIERARKKLQSRVAPILGIEIGTSLGQRHQALQVVEQTLTTIVRSYRIVAIKLPSGGAMQFCLRADQRLAGQEPEIASRREYLEKKPRAWKKRLELAELCYHSGHWEEAQEDLSRVLSVNPRCFPAALQLGEILEREGRLEEAAEVYQRALDQKPLGVAAADLQARLQAARGNDEGAVLSYREAIALAPGRLGSYYGLHRALGRLSRYEEQLQNLDHLLEIDPDNLFALVECYTPCARLLRFELARSRLERAVEVDPNDPLAVKHLFQARMNLLLKDEESLRLAQRLVELAPDFVESWSELAWIYAELGRDQESLAVLQKFLEEHPENAQAHSALAWRCNYLKCGTETMFHARRAYELAPHDPHICWTALMANPEAPVVQEIAARFPEDAFMQEQIASCLLSKAKAMEALPFALKAVGLSPAMVSAARVLGEVYESLGRWEEAAEVYRRTLEMAGGRNVGILMRYGRTLRAVDSPEADRAFSEASQLSLRAGDLRAAADVYEVWGKREEAIQAYHQILLQSPLPTHHRIHAESSLQRLNSSITDPQYG